MVRPIACVGAGLCAALFAATAAAQDFVPVADAAPARPVVALGPDVRLVVLDEALWRVTASERARVPCTQPAGTGAVQALAKATGGTVFVAAANGWFVLDAEHPVLDPMDLRDGVPPGAPRGLAVDAAGRLWVATEDAFGVLDPRFGFGRTFTAEDGVPAAPYRGLSLDGDGRVLLRTRDGAFAYTPDVGPPPQRTDGGAARFAVTATPDGDAVLDLAVAGRGGASLRQRRQHDHQLRPMDGAVLRGLRQGRHTVEVHAVDRDLRRAVVAVCDVHVPLRPQFDTRLLPWFAGAAALLLFVLAWRRTRSGTAPLRRLTSAAGSAALVFVCALQLLAACLGYGRSWPFVGFSMYTENWLPQAVLYKPRLEGLLADGTRVRGSEHEIGLLQDGYWQMLAEGVFGGEAAQRDLLQRWNGNRHAGLPRLAGFRLLDGRIRLTPDGPVDVAPTVMVEYVAR